MSKRLVNAQKFEINKPSELCQVVFVQKFKKTYEIYKISPLELDLMNAVMYRVRETIIKENISINTEIPSTLFEMKLQDFTSLFGGHNYHDYKPLIEKLTDLSEVKIVINALGKNKDIEETVLTRFIHEIRLSKHKHQKDQVVRIAVSNLIIDKFLNIKKYFSKMFFSIQFSLVSKYSKLLYELLKDYEGIKHITVDILEFQDLLNVTELSQRKWSIFQGNILSKSIDEINEKSDIIVSYEPIKEKLEGQRKQVTKIKFNIEKQPESRLKELGLIEPTIDSLPFYNKSKAKLDDLVKNGYKVVDEEMWIKTDIKKNEERYDAEVRLDTWVKETPQDAKNNIFSTLASTLENCEDVTVYIKDYKILGIFSQDAFSRNPIETMNLLNAVIIDSHNRY